MCICGLVLAVGSAEKLPAVQSVGFSLLVLRPCTPAACGQLHPKLFPMFSSFCLGVIFFWPVIFLCSLFFQQRGQTAHNLEKLYYLSRAFRSELPHNQTHTYTLTTLGLTTSCARLATRVNSLQVAAYHIWAFLCLHTISEKALVDGV